jgi:hypothetical protein
MVLGRGGAAGGDGVWWRDRQSLAVVLWGIAWGERICFAPKAGAEDDPVTGPDQFYPRPSGSLEAEKQPNEIYYSDNFRGPSQMSYELYLNHMQRFTNSYIDLAVWNQDVACLNY